MKKLTTLFCLGSLLVTDSVAAQETPSQGIASAVPKLELAKVLPGDVLQALKGMYPSGVLTLAAEIDSKTTSPMSSKLEQGTRFDLEARIELPPNGRVDYKVHKVAPWINGPSPWHEEEATTMFDGTNWWTFVGKAGPKGQMGPRNEAVILKEPPPQVVMRWSNGEPFITPLYRVFGEQTLWEHLNGAPLLATTAKVEPAPDGALKLVLERGYPGTGVTDQQTIVLQPKLGFMITEASWKRGVSGSGPPASQCDMVCDAPERSPQGMFFPKQGRFDYYSKGNKRIEMVASISRFSWSDSKTEEFKPKVAKGWRVTDERFGVSFPVGDSATEILNNVRQQIDNER